MIQAAGNLIISSGEVNGFEKIAKDSAVFFMIISIQAATVPDR